MTALELHRQHPSLELAPILRVIKYMGFDSNSLSPGEVDRTLDLYHHFEHDPELVIGIEAVGRLTNLEAVRLTELLGEHRHEIPYLGTTTHPMVPLAAIAMIRAVAAGDDPMEASDERLYTLTEMAERTDISLASLSKYVKQHADRIPSRTVGRMRKFPRQAVVVFQQIKAENIGRRGNGHDRIAHQKAAVNRRYAIKLADLETQLDAAVEVSRGLSRTLGRLSRQVRRARAVAETGSRISETEPPARSRRTGGHHRPDTIVAACRTILAAATDPMRVADITERVIVMGTPIKAKNPNVTVSSILSSYDDFGRVRRGYYELLRRDDPMASAQEGDEIATREATASPPEGAVAPTMAQNPADILAELQAAADSGDPGGATPTEKSPDQAEGAPGIGLEPFGAAG